MTVFAISKPTHIAKLMSKLMSKLKNQNNQPLIEVYTTYQSAHNKIDHTKQMYVK